MLTTGFEPARPKADTSPSSWRVYQFHHVSNDVANLWHYSRISLNFWSNLNIPNYVYFFISRLIALSFRLSRLSWIFLPFAIPISIFANPLAEINNSMGTIVIP